MYFVINKSHHNSSKIKLFIKQFINFFFRFKFLRINYFYHLSKYNFYKNFNYLKLDKNCTILDFGANIGSVSLYLSDIFDPKIYCYEPNPECFEYLKKIFKNNKKIKIYNKGVSNKSQKLKLYLSKENKISFFDGASYDKEKRNVFSKNYFTTNTENVDKILSKHKSIDLLKVDVEGWEYKIIHSIIRNIYKIKVVFVELHNSSFEQKKLYFKTLKLLKKRKLLNTKIFLWI